MTRFLLCIISLLYTIGIYANVSHLSFDGLSLSGDIGSFSTSLEQKGYKKLGDTEFICNNDGDFKGSIIRILNIGDHNEVHGLCVFLNESNNWDDLIQDYYHWKAQLIIQYGVPTEDHTDFNSSSFPLTSTEKMRSLKSGECDYSATFSCDKGIITLCLNFSEEFGTRPQIIYMDMGMGEYMLDKMEHLHFMGIPITGTVEEFVSELKNKKFTYITTYNGTVIMTGRFAGYHNCLIYIDSVENKNIVCNVSISFPQRTKWNQVYTDYKSILGNLIKKYGKPSEMIETFQTQQELLDDKDKWSFAITDRFDFHAHFTLEYGHILISIAHINSDNDCCYVQLIYMDSINTLRDRSNGINDL